MGAVKHDRHYKSDDTGPDYRAKNQTAAINFYGSTLLSMAVVYSLTYSPPSVAIGAAGRAGTGVARRPALTGGELEAGLAAKAADDWPILSGIVRDAAKGKGNFGLGSGTASQAQRAGESAGESWVGDGFTVASDGKTLVSRDGLRQWRPPSYKPKLDKWQSNFEYRRIPRGPWQGNGHLDITDMP